MERVVKFFFGFLAFIAAVVVVILLIVGLVRTTRSNDTKSLVKNTVTLTDDSMISSVARYTVTSPIVADENYRETRITISQNARTVEVLQGYDKKVEKTATLPNTANAYKAFLGALAATKFSARRDKVSGNLRTTCVTGNHYLFELSLNAEKKVDTWSSSCSSKDGSFAGDIGGTEQIFKDQFPNYSEVTTTTRGTYNLAPL
jgi:hypothetical protein